ncbi:MAG: OmpA family protein [Flavobacteriales bacterium]
MKFRAKYWNEAINAYKEEIPKEKDKGEMARKTYNLGYSYFMMHDYKHAIEEFQKAKDVKYSEAHPEVLYYLALSYKANCEYDKALAEFNAYKERVPGDKKTLNAIKSIELSIEWQKNPTRYKVENVVLLNSPEDDANPAYSAKGNKDIVFYSSRSGSTGKGTSEILGQDFPDLYFAKLDKNGKWSTPALLNKEVNTEFTEGAPTFDAKFNTMYFTRCGGENEKRGCQIYTSKKGGGDANYGPGIAIPLAADSLVVAHPALSPNDQVLYFVSDMPGGQGGKDIWYATYNKKDNVWEKPTNLGPEINTPQDELFPYIHADGTLYFSSDGHIGMGGFDLFKAAKTQDGFGPVINLKFPLNSCSDDISIAFEDKAERGYITSNREGTKGKYDIWSFVLPKLECEVKGLVVDKVTKEVIPGAKVYLVGSDGSQKDTVADANGAYRFKLTVNVSYDLNAVSDAVHSEGLGRKGKRKYFSSATSMISCVDLMESKIYDQPIELEPIPSTPIELPNIEYEYRKADLKPEAKVVLRTFYKEVLLPNNTLTIELGSHTDARGSNASNGKLAQDRAQSAVNYLIELGVDPSRLKAEGYGEEKPKEITESNKKFVAKGYESYFPVGTRLTEAFINSLKTKELQEVAHQMNRRTEFRILCDDWVPGKAADACNK